MVSLQGHIEALVEHPAYVDVLLDIHAHHAGKGFAPDEDAVAVVAEVVELELYGIAQEVDLYAGVALGDRFPLDGGVAYLAGGDTAHVAGRDGAPGEARGAGVHRGIVTEAAASAYLVTSHLAY